METLQLRNFSESLKDRRFGAISSSASIAIHHWGHLNDYLNMPDKQTSDRNQLACVVRGLLQSSVLQFCIAAKAILGHHLHEPFTNAIVEKNITRTQCLLVLPALYKELLNPPNDVLCLNQPAIPCLTSSWLQDPYSPQQTESLEVFIRNSDKSALSELVKQLMTQDAEVLKRQRGPEYGIGEENQDHPQFVKNQLPPGKEHLLDTIPSHNLEAEHFFGDLTQRLEQTGGTKITHTSDCMVIESNADKAFKDHAWQNKENKEIFERMKQDKKKFEIEQVKLRKKGLDVTQDLLDKIEAGRCKAGKMEQLKKHDGPITNTTDL